MNGLKVNNSCLQFDSHWASAIPRDALLLRLSRDSMHEALLAISFPLKVPFHGVHRVSFHIFYFFLLLFRLLLTLPNIVHLC